MNNEESAGLPFILWSDSDDDGHGFAMIHDGCVKHLTIKEGVYDPATFSSPASWLPALVSFLDSGIDKWTRAVISRHSATKGLTYYVVHEPVPGVKDVWHPKMIDLRELTNFEQLASNSPTSNHVKLTAAYCPMPLQTQDSLLLSSYRTALANSPRIFIKISQWDEGMDAMRRETEIYGILSKHSEIAPKFLGHIHERNEITGFALEYIQNGRQIESAEDLPCCEAVLQRFNGLGFSHNAISRKSFIIDDNGGRKRAPLVDFRYATKRTGRPVRKDDMAKFRDLEARYCVPVKREPEDTN
ncbi:hypothetical protein KEM56_006181 [Ascosphaera pollenicola]|nr:hypothetical protein KEM56_006181 [Ascosphaera pollenicola]